MSAQLKLTLFLCVLMVVAVQLCAAEEEYSCSSVSFSAFLGSVLKPLVETDPACVCLQCQGGTLVLASPDSSPEDLCVLDQDDHVSAVRFLQVMVVGINSSHCSLLPNVSVVLLVSDTCSLQSTLGAQVRDDLSIESADETVVENFQSILERVLTEKLNLPAGIPEGVSFTTATLFSVTADNGTTVLYPSLTPIIRYGAPPPLPCVEADCSSDTNLALVMADLVAHFNWSHVTLLYSNTSCEGCGMEVLLQHIKTGPGSITIELLPIPALASDEELDCLAMRMNQASVRDASAVLVFGDGAEVVNAIGAVQRLLSSDTTSPLRYVTWVTSDSLSLDVTEYDFFQSVLRVEKLSDVSNTSSDYQEFFGQCAVAESDFTRTHTAQDTAQDQSGTQQAECSDTNSEISLVIREAFQRAQQGEVCVDYESCYSILVHHAAGLKINSSMLRDCLLQNSSCSPSNGTANTTACTVYSIMTLQFLSNGSLAFTNLGCWDTVNGLTISSTEVQIGVRNAESVNCPSLQYPALSCANHPCVEDSCTELPEECQRCVLCLANGSGDPSCLTCPHPDSDRSLCRENTLKQLSLSNDAYIVLSCVAILGLVLSLLVGLLYVMFHHLLQYDLHLRILLWLTGVLLYVTAMLYLNMPSHTNCLLRRLLGVCLSLSFGPLLARAVAMFRLATNLNTYRMPLFIGPLSQLVVGLFFVLCQIAITILWVELEDSTVEYNITLGVTEVRCGGDFFVGLAATFVLNILLSLYSFFYSCRCLDDLPENVTEAMFCRSVVGLTFLLSTFMVTFVMTAGLTAFASGGAEFYSILCMVAFCIVMASVLVGWPCLTVCCRIVTCYCCKAECIFASGREGHPKSVPIPGELGLRLTVDGKHVKALTQKVIDDGKQLMCFNSTLSFKRLHTLLYDHADELVPIYEQDAERYVDPVVTADGKVLRVHTEPIFYYSEETRNR